jgi:hypothetical protein
MAGRLPWEYDKDDEGRVVRNDERLEKLKEAIQLVVDGKSALREAAEWLSSVTQKEISHVAFRNKFSPVQRAKISKGGYLTPAEREAKKKEKIKQRLAAAKNKKYKAKQYAKKLKKDTDTLQSKMKPGVQKSKAGRIISSEEMEDFDEVLQEAAEQTIIFQPNPGPQERFLAAPETDVLFGGAAGGGKSYAMVVDPLRYGHKRAHRALILRKSLKELRDLIDISRNLYPQVFPGAKYKESEKIWTFPSGARIEFGYLEQDSDVYQYQGQAYTWIGFDEITHLHTEFPWNYLGSRLRTTDPDIELYMRATANPGGPGHTWVKKRYIDPAEPGISFKDEHGISRKFIPAKLSDNPYLAKDGRYEQMLMSMDEVTRRRLLDGDWNVIEGSAFPEFTRELHVVQPFSIPHNWFRFKGVDYGYSAPSAAVWCAVDPDDGTILVYRELYRSGLTGEDLARFMVELEISESRSIPGVLDTAAWNRTGYTGPTIGEILNNPPYNLKLRPADKNRIAGKIQVHERLKINLETGRPKLQIFNTCENIIRELENLPLDKTKTEDVDTKAEDHAYDALRYALMSRPRVNTFDDWARRAKTNMMYAPADNTFGY